MEIQKPNFFRVWFSVVIYGNMAYVDKRVSLAHEL